MRAFTAKNDDPNSNSIIGNMYYATVSVIWLRTDLVQNLTDATQRTLYIPKIQTAVNRWT